MDSNWKSTLFVSLQDFVDQQVLATSIHQRLP